MVNYQEGRIYKLTVDGSDLVYYGSTTSPLWKRMSIHKNNYNRWKDDKNTRKCTSTALFEIGTPIITLVETFPCNSKEELYACERFHIENNPCVNKVIPGRNQSEYGKVYYKNNIDHIKEYQKKYNSAHKEEAATRVQKYRENHTEFKAIKQKRDKERYQSNKERITCSCGSIILQCCWSKHCETKKHLNLLKLKD